MKSQMKKSITLVLVMTMLLSVLASFPSMSFAATDADDPTKYKLYTTEAGSVMVERRAENMLNLCLQI